ncbi:DUF1850 domain-containing protein [Robertmurraya kyonggiensis]|uniref:DUF1850 domain-containing protein n=2 Tax=Robertmurraya kyonggiensis TaxID=1037680 RepID=A0A4U1DFV3_9BACI|nr:DUF1850 domain-containing protein [Robertmurraya kyonggiensis]
MPIKEALVFEYQNTEKVLAYLPSKKEQAFQIKYTHSIHLSDVVESYQVSTDGQLKQFELQFEDFAIGMPSEAGEGETFEEKNGIYYIKNMNRVFPYFDLRTGKVRANHKIIFEDREYPLSNYIEPGTWVRIKFKRINLLQRLKGANILDK